MNLGQEPTLMKSKFRVQKHGEVFTPQWVVDKMISIPGIKEKTEDVFATFLEPSAGEGAFLLAIENLKLRYVYNNYSKELWNVYALWALTSIYGIEFLQDNLIVARQNMLDLFATYYEMVNDRPISEETDIYRSAQTIITANIVQGNTLTRKNRQGEDIVFSRWSQVSDAERMVERTEFTYSSLFSESNQCKLEMFEQASEDIAPKYAITDIEQVWREE